MMEAEVRAAFLLAGIKHGTLFQLANQYWPDCDEYADTRRQSPWWLVAAPFGMVKIGERKRVIAISWKDTGLRAVVTLDEVTKDETMVHAWTMAKVVEYLTSLRRAAEKAGLPVPLETSA